MSTAAPAPLVTVKPSRARSATGLLRGTGPAGIASAAVIAVATVLAVIGPLIAPYNPTLPNLGLNFIGPSGGHMLGYDFEGRDVLSRLLAGAQSSMLGPLAVVIGALVLGIAARRDRGLAPGRGRRGDLLQPGRAVRVPRHPARGTRRRRVRCGPDRRVHRARGRLHAVRGPGAARRRAEGTQPALRRRARGAGGVGDLDLPAAHHPQHRAADRRPGDHHVRLRDGRPGRHLLPRARRAAARRRTGA